MAVGTFRPAFVICILYTLFTAIFAEVLTPPTFNLAKGRNITATATCGYEGAEPGPVYLELYCRLTGATGNKKDDTREIIQGQLCDYCNPAIPEKNHSIAYAIGGTADRWWQSPPLSRGNEYNQVDIVINLEQEFHIAYVIIEMANSPRPGVWALEKSRDYGETWEPWQYFADTPSDCEVFFDTPISQKITADDQVICTDEFSKIVPLENGEVVVSLTDGRPSAKNFSYADTLKSFMKATDVRIRLLRTKTLLGHLMAKARQDPTVTRRYFYSIKHISLGGQCDCNGHAESCNYLDPSRPNRLICDCQHNTAGDQCERCDSARGFVQKKWQPARAYRYFECEPCQCYGRASACEYDPQVDEDNLSIDIHGYYSGGGVCQECQYNSTGINCEQCLPGFFRPFGVPVSRLDMCKPCDCDPHFHTGECEEGSGRCLCRPEYTGSYCDSCSIGYYGYPNCIPCDCDVNGTEGDICHVNGGQCPCKENFIGKKCDMCQRGYYDFPTCGPCDCNMIGSVDDYCDEYSGQCRCNINYGGRNCSECANGYFNYPDCALCACDPVGAVEEICDKTVGDCICKDNFNGERCDVCARGYYGYPDCMACQCQEEGSISNICDDRTGQCRCKPNYVGQNCERCAPSFYRYPDCSPCECDLYGSLGRSCDQETGQCDCRYNFRGLMCDKCKEGLYNYPNCEECNCNPAGAKEVPGYPLGGCGEVIQGRLCECKERVIGRICDTCIPGYWNLNRNNILGCEACQCSKAGTIAGMNICNMITGQCMCKVDVTGRNCDRCKDGFYGLHKTNVYGCVECNCDIGGSESPVCDKETGQCVCKPRVEGKRCELPIRQHFIPTLDQIKYEIEDGVTPEGAQIRYGYDDRLFPDFSWRGYAILTTVQPEVVLDVEINKPSLYRLVYRFVNLNEEPVTGEVTFKPQSAFDIEQKGEVLFISTSTPAFAGVGNNGGMSTFVLNPGVWTISVDADASIFLDYMFLIPQAYYEATVLQNQVYRPCRVGDEGPCIHYSYPEILDYPRVHGESGYIYIGDKRYPIELFDDQDILDQLNVNSMAVLNPNQTNFFLDLNVTSKDRYVLILKYFSTDNATQNLLFNINDTDATSVLYNCEYSSLCRQVVSGLDEMEAIFDLDEGTYPIKVTGDSDVNSAIESIVAVPYDRWAIGYIRPSIVCIRVNGVCVGSKYSLPVGSVRVDFESLPNDHLVAKELPFGVTDTDAQMVRLNDTLNLIVLLGSARGPGPHKMVVHYYLPSDVGSEMPVTLYTNGHAHKGVFSPRFCPSTRGCRGLIHFDGHTSVNLEDPNVKIVFNNTKGQEIWLDYLLMVPANQYSAQDINLLPIDNSRSFIEDCVDEGYKIITPMSDFCEASLFTLTTEFNNGALECECDIDGSQSFNCDPNGGQCQCKPNVIGRTCSACRVGYYGFPRCQPCNCPFGLCHQVTGACICPPRVTGDRCDVCKPGSYGYDGLIGCQECQCNVQGVVDRDINCDEITGQCRCLPGIGGRKCDYCLPGFHAFPLCRECDCDRYGTEEEICDVDTGYCICKSAVVGPRCDQCDLYTFNLDPGNPAGCTQCFCFGNTRSCRESSLRWTVLMDMKNWEITNTDDGEVLEAGDTIAARELTDGIVDTSTSMYWIAPPAYLGNRMTSYGGFLRYEVLFVLPRNESVETEAIIEPDLILQGNNITLVYRSFSQPLNSVFTKMDIQLVEYDFQTPAGNTVDRETFMLVLVNLQALQLRASYYSVVQEVRLTNVELDVATEDGDGELAVSVEQCACPAGHTGTSCEDCSKGYYRVQNVNYPYLASCRRCECHGHASECDQETGICLDCANNTMGDHCELCILGYYGEPTYGQACSICGCPLKIESNNFADTCVVAYGGDTYCDCYEGYVGSKCERCAPGYFGNPMEPNSTCELCSCSGNIDMTDPEACDFQTGACLFCINNSTGPRCDRCRDWWYGDAVVEKDCYPCSCDQCGSVSCSSTTGTCTCKPNVIGVNCDRCAPDTFGYDSCNGCTDCNCSPASVSTQCDLDTGNCTCQPGVRGQKCDACMGGYWNYQETGCEMCDCTFDGAVTCDAKTGRCLCLPGVTGPRCDTCLDRWVLIPNEGCRECDECTHYLMDDIDYLDGNITEVQSGLTTVSIGVEAMKRLDRANQTVFDLQPVVNSVLYESENITLDPLEKEFDNVAVISGNLLTRSNVLITNADGLMEDAATLANHSAGAEKLGMRSEVESSNAVRYVQDILNQILQGIQVTNIETYITLSEQIMDEVRMRNFSMENEAAMDELQNATLLLQQVKEMQSVPEEQMNANMETMKGIDNVVNRLVDLQNHSTEAEATSSKALNMIADLRENVVVSIQELLDEIILADDATLDTLDMATEQLNSGQEYVETSTEEFRQLAVVNSQMLQAEAAMNQFNQIFMEELGQAEAAVNDSLLHADDLEDQGVMLASIYTDTRDVAANAVDAGKAYENIVKAIDAAHDAARTALNAAESAKMKSGGVGELSQNMSMSSEELRIEAVVRYNTTQIGLLARLSDAVEGTNDVEVMNNNVQDKNEKVISSIGILPVGQAGDKANLVKMNGEAAASDAQDSMVSVQDIIDGLPEQLGKTKPLVNDVVATNRDINLARTQVGNVQKFIPDIRTLLTDLADESEKVQGLGRQVTANIAALKEKIDIARNQANRIRVGLKFLGNTTVTLRNPPSVDQAGSYSKVSLFFKTAAENALLLYAGSDRSGIGRANQDYMSVELENGNVVFKYDLGAGAAKISHPHYVSDNKWYKVTAKRIGKAGTLTLERDPKEAELGSVTGKTRGTYTVLELNPLSAKFYVGGIPSEATISDEVSRVNYVGVMESVEFDEHPMGLWNFEDGENNYFGARERDILTSIVSNGFRFDGTGYVILSTKDIGWIPAVKSEVALRLQTYAENGLVFFAGDGNRDFISIEMRNGKILYQFDLGGGRAVLESDVMVNDGKWHDVMVQRINKTGQLFVDSQQVGPAESPGSLTQLSITDDISVGGYQDIILPASGVTKQGFEGCIENLALQLATWDLNLNKKAKGVSPGCPEQVARVATFSSDKLSYVARPSESIGNNFDITFKMKTKQNEALLMYVGHSEQDSGFSVSVVNGMISVISDPGGENLKLTTRVNTYNDGRWHYISIMKMGKKNLTWAEDCDIEIEKIYLAAVLKPEAVVTRYIHRLMMNIDDYEMIQGTGEGTKNSLETNMPLYFGNADVPLPANLVGSSKQLDGCIGDVTVNGEFLNFATLPDSKRPGISLSGCPIPDPVGPYEREEVPTLPPWAFTTESTTEATTLPPGKCALEVVDPVELSDEDISGYYFGAYPNTRIEFSSLTRFVRIRSAFSMEFQTTAENGVLFYFADKKNIDNIALVMKDGQIRYSFNSGTGPGVITTPDKYNDGQNHMLKVGRSMREGSMEIDGQIIGVTNSQGRARSINGIPPFYFGGLDGARFNKRAVGNLGGVTEGFVGCIGNIKFNDKKIDEPPVTNNTVPCSDLTEIGSYFYGDGGYIKLVDSFSVGLDLSVSVEVRPRSLNGILFSVHGKGDFVVLQLVRGELWFTADNGAGSIISKYIPEMNNKLCDGAWHTIKAVKAKNVVLLEVDDNDPITTTSSGSATSADTEDPIYIGGKPDSITKGIRAKGKYRGCIRNLSINGEKQYLTLGEAVEMVKLESCPAN